MIRQWRENENRIFRITNDIVFEDIEMVACIHDVPNQWAFDVFLSLIVQGYSYGTSSFEDKFSREVMSMKIANS